MDVPNVLQNETQQNSFTQKPAIKNNSWLFGGLSAAELLPKLQQFLLGQEACTNWQLAWLNNDGRPVIGLLPKVSWSIYLTDNQADDVPPFTYKVIKNFRTCEQHPKENDNAANQIANMSYAQWQQEVIAYSQTFINSANRNSTDKNSADKNSGHLENDEATSSIDQADKQPSYYHGLIGFIGYDIAAYELSAAVKTQQTPQPVSHHSSQPCAVLGHYDIYLTPSHTDSEPSAGWSLQVINHEQAGENEPSQTTLNRLISYLNKLDEQLSYQEKSKDSFLPLLLTPRWCKEDYQRAFKKTQGYLHQGDCYQINLTQAWQGSLSQLDPPITKLINYLPALHRNTQAPFAGYLGLTEFKSHWDTVGATVNDNTGKPERSLSFELLSCSPELFFTFIKNPKDGTHHIRTKPIKGTRPRSTDPKQDLSLRQDLIDSDKDRSENVMIVDLLRNDLGKYAKTGSVKVPKLFAIESFSNVHHMVSTITAELQPNVHPLAVLFGSLPAGSITGTPKRRAVEIISELEGSPRGAYCGTLGYMNFDGSGQWNVLIRTLQAHRSADTDTQISLWAGGGITVASDCEDEYQECLDKVGNLLKVLQR